MNSSSLGDPGLAFAINTVSFNAKGDYFALGATNCFQIYQTEPF